MKDIDLKTLKNNPDKVQKLLDEVYLGLGDTSDLIFTNPLNPKSQFDIEHPHIHLLSLMRKPEYFPMTCKWLFNIDLLPFQAMILRELWQRKFPMLIGSRGLSKTFLLSLYCMLKALFDQKSKVVVVGAAFRQSKLLFEYMETFWRDSPILQHIVGKGKQQGPRRDIDRCTFYLGNSVITAIPLGNGEKIRGLRANVVVADEFASISEEIFETVVGGFAAVNLSPVEAVKHRAKIDLLKQLNMWSSEMEKEEESLGMGNQTIISGTAYYSFNHFAKYHKRWREIVKYGRDKKKLEEIFNGEIPESFNPNHYSVMRIPYHSLPKDFMDSSTVARAKATIHASTYLMEYGACVLPGTLIITNSGVKNIEDIEVGDLVLTHKGRFRKVNKRMYRDYIGNVHKYKTFGYNQYVSMTEEHPFYNEDGTFTKFNHNETCISNLKELYGSGAINIEDICTDYLETPDGLFIYPRGSRAKFNVQEQRLVRKSNLPNCKVADEYSLNYASVSYIRNSNRKPKCSIRKWFPLNYESGLIVGYYAAEGSIGANGKQTEFALDEHKDTEYQQQLLDAIKSVFNIDGKLYVKDKNTVSIAINSRLIAEIMKYICPGICYNKIIKHEILFSNNEFLRGVIEGYWNGDGHIRDEFASASSSSIDLLNQIRVALSYFNVSSSIRYCESQMENREDYYKLDIHGYNLREFLYQIYNLDINNENRINSSKIINTGDVSKLSVMEYESIHYDGLVYNLEVDEDNSYSCLNATVHNCFADDSNGFFKRTLIESCICTNLEHNPINFSAVVRGNPNGTYIYGVDPASETDNFAIVIVEKHGDHSRIVYSWTMNRKKHRERISKNVIEEHDFYDYCCRKIRDLMKIFPTEHIGIDAQGGGRAIMENLQDPNKLKDGEQRLLPYTKRKDDEFWWEKPDKDTDGEQGLHIIHAIEFANSAWTSESNHGLRMDFEQKKTLFPHFDPWVIEESIAYDKSKGMKEEMYSLHDTLEDCVLEIEELKDELTTIEYTQTGIQGRDKWDTPEYVKKNGRKGRLRKDRYSALVIANMISRTIIREIPSEKYQGIGGFAGKDYTDLKTQNANPYYGNAKHVNRLPIVGMVVKRNGV